MLHLLVLGSYTAALQTKSGSSRHLSMQLYLELTTMVVLAGLDQSVPRYTVKAAVLLPQLVILGLLRQISLKYEEKWLVVTWRLPSGVGLSRDREHRDSAHLPSA